jgi:hypothetical protein
MRTLPLLAAATLALSAYSSTGTAQPADGGPSKDRYQQQMNSMGDMHHRMQIARTPEERQALMAEHMQVVLNGMRMMCDVSADGTPASAAPTANMQKCMDMRDATILMMMDREMKRAPAK